jgi:uncharacterized protein YjbJ (UPF0337 family)
VTPIVQVETNQATGGAPNGTFSYVAVLHEIRRLHRKEIPMDKDRIQGSAKEAKGAIKEVAGKVTGDAKLQADGKADKTAGKIQNAVGGVKDALRGM